MWRGELPFLSALPAAAGHEMIGEVVGLGEGRRTDSLGRPLRSGDRVAYAYFTPCGSCPACSGGIAACPNRYAARASLSVNDPPHFHGAFGDFYVVKPSQWVFKLPDTLPTRLAVPANCAVSQALAGLDRARIRLGDAVVVQGLGGIGIYAVALARDMGAGTVIGVDRIPQRLEFARRFGADMTIDLNELPEPADRVAAVQELCGGADVVIELAGVPQVLSEGIAYLRPGGRYILIGNVQANLEATIVPQSIVRAGKELIGVVTYPQWALPRALTWLDARQSAYPFADLVARAFTLEQINEAIAASDWAASQGDLGRAVITMSE
jgi:threonine dehydrogenase-like Zn-dependent dehydrogenase